MLGEQEHRVKEGDVTVNGASQGRQLGWKPEPGTVTLMLRGRGGTNGTNAGKETTTLSSSQKGPGRGPLSDTVAI